MFSPSIAFWIPFASRLCGYSLPLINTYTTNHSLDDESDEILSRCRFYWGICMRRATAWTRSDHPTPYTLWHHHDHTLTHPLSFQCCTVSTQRTSLHSTNQSYVSLIGSFLALSDNILPKWLGWDTSFPVTLPWHNERTTRSHRRKP